MAPLVADCLDFCIAHSFTGPGGSTSTVIDDVASEKASVALLYLRHMCRLVADNAFHCTFSVSLDKRSNMQPMHNLHSSLHPSSSAKKQDPSNQTTTLNGSFRESIQDIWDGCERLLWSLATSGSQRVQEID